MQRGLGVDRSMKSLEDPYRNTKEDKKKDWNERSPKEEEEQEENSSSSSSSSSSHQQRSRDEDRDDFWMYVKVASACSLSIITSCTYTSIERVRYRVKQYLLSISLSILIGVWRRDNRTRINPDTPLSFFLASFCLFCPIFFDSETFTRLRCALYSFCPTWFSLCLPSYVSLSVSRCIRHTETARSAVGQIYFSPPMTLGKKREREILILPLTTQFTRLWRGIWQGRPFLLSHLMLILSSRWNSSL